ncbi:class I SAM-dependent RNA methyltransferase [uncultured Jatrophihabitans sp.]|uniref:class I SAM-dependent RNA methyltransferase n=1 Tax=uncultured Jatrophihabitans sp. TaxID=1610747 RepID=UPI0035CBE8BC
MVDGPLLGAELELDVGAPAAGGACVAREPGGRVVFVRHALPGERVRALVTEDRGGSFCRADAVEVLRASADRVPQPCPHARAGGCGGCDWQHATGPAQRELKATVIREQFARIGSLRLDDQLFGGVEELPGGLLGWRTRVAYAVDGAGRLGLRRHHSHEVERLERCPLGAPGVGDAPALGDTWPGRSGLELARGDEPAVAVLGHTPGGGRPGQVSRARGARRPARGRRPPDRVQLIDGPSALRHAALGRSFQVAAAGFWQVHPAAAETLATALLAAVEPRPGETALDLYAGAGLLTAALAEAVGRDGSVLGIEADPQAVADAAANLRDLPWATVRRGRVGTGSGGELWPAHVDLVVLDPPRTGAGPDVMRRIAATRPRAIGYVSCDAGTLARDVAALREAGWTLAALRAFDAFPMTQHVECLATLRPAPGG